MSELVAMPKRRAPVQGEGPYWMRREHWPERERTQVPGSITWAEHLEVFEAYAARYGRGQSAERMAERGGFGFFEAADLLGRPLKTWEPRP